MRTYDFHLKPAVLINVVTKKIKTTQKAGTSCPAAVDSQHVQTVLLYKEISV